MARILINGINSKVGGGKSILLNFLTACSEQNKTNEFIFLTPDDSQYAKFSSKNIKILPFKRILNSKIATPFSNHFIIPNLIKKLNIQILVNLADIPIPTDIPQIYLFDWPHAVYSKNHWGHVSFFQTIQIQIKLAFIKKYFKHITELVAQTESIKSRLLNLYPHKPITVIPNAVSSSNSMVSEHFSYDVPKNKTKLLCLSHYYPHKNIEILVEVAKLLKSRQLPYSILITLAPSQHTSARNIINTINTLQLSPYLINIGPVLSKYLPNLYNQIDGLLLPSIMESFSGTYVEAMFYEKPILTSNLDFAIDVCGDAAEYFNPKDAQSILSSILKVYENPKRKYLLVQLGNERFKNYPDWNIIFSKFLGLVDKYTSAKS